MALNLIPLQAKIAIISILIISALWYVYDLKLDNAELTTENATLSGKIELQNNAIQNAKKDRDDLQAKIDESVKKNKKLKDDLAKKSKELLDRPAAKTCDEAIINLKNTAKAVADEWNSK